MSDENFFSRAFTAPVLFLFLLLPTSSRLQEFSPEWDLRIKIDHVCNVRELGFVMEC